MKLSTLRWAVMFCALMIGETAFGAVDQAADSGSDATSERLEEVIVTATRRQEVLFNVPLSVSAFTGEEISKRLAQDLTDILLAAPGVSATTAGTGKNAIYIRGLSSRNGDSHVGYYLDDIPFNFIGFSILPDVRTFDLERVEVLRGPQGTLYGASSLGGTVRILTADPVLDQLTTSGELLGSSTSGGGGNYGAKLGLNVPLIDEVLAVRGVITKEKYSGWLDNPALGENLNDSDIETLRLKVGWRPSERLNIVAMGMSYNGDFDASDEGTEDGLGVLNPSDLDYDAFNLGVVYSAQGFDLTSSTSYFDFSNPQQSAGGINFAILADSKSQEFRLVSAGDNTLDWILGAYFRDLSTDFLIDAFSIGDFNIPAATQTTTSESMALYGEIDYELTQDWSLSFGLRGFSDDRGRYDTGFNFSTGAPYVVDSGETYDGVTFKLGTSWQPSDRLIVFANIAEGYRPGVTQPGITLDSAAAVGVDVPLLVPEETSLSYELGTRMGWLNGRVSMEAVVYFIDWDDLQTSYAVVPGVVSAIITAGRAESRGLDFSLSTLVTDHWSIELSGNVQDPVYKEGVADSLGVIFSSGDQIVGTPKRTFSLWTFFSKPISSRFSGIASVGLDYNSERLAISRAAATQGVSDALTQVSANLGIDNGRWSLSIYGSNLTNEDGAIDPSLTSAPGIGPVASRLRPRTVGLRFQWHSR